jgi:hypothetical protein
VVEGQGPTEPIVRASGCRSDSQPKLVGHDLNNSIVPPKRRQPLCVRADAGSKPLRASCRAEQLNGLCRKLDMCSQTDHGPTEGSRREDLTGELLPDSLLENNQVVDMG